MEKLKSRKFLITLIVIAVGAAIDLATERGLSETYALLLGAIAGVYNAANALVHRGEASKPAPVISGGISDEEKDALTATLNQLAANQMHIHKAVTDTQETQAQLAKTAANTQKLLSAIASGGE